MAVVAFSFPQFIARFPAYATQDPNYLQALFNEAGLYVDNTDCSVICNVTLRAMILNLTLAHLLALYATVNGQTPSTIPGRISDATQGSVSVGATLDYPPGSAQWWASSVPGAAAYAALTPYRTARYFPGYVRNIDPLAPIFIGGAPGIGYPTV
jgi:hypothetical protein